MSGISQNLVLGPRRKTQGWWEPAAVASREFILLPVLGFCMHFVCVSLSQQAVTAGSDVNSLAPPALLKNHSLLSVVSKPALSNSSLCGAFIPVI